MPAHAAAADGVGPARAHVWPVIASLGTHVQVALAPVGVQVTGVNVGGVVSTEMLKVAVPVPGLPAASEPLTVKV